MCRQGGGIVQLGRCSSHRLLLRAVPADQLDFWDVVEYQQQPSSSPSATLRLGLVQQVGALLAAGLLLGLGGYLPPDPV